MSLGAPGPGLRGAVHVSGNAIPQTQAPPGLSKGKGLGRPARRRFKKPARRRQARGGTDQQQSAQQVVTDSKEKASSVLVSGADPRTKEEAQKDASYKIRLPWENRTEEEEEAMLVEQRRKGAKKFDSPAPGVECDDKGLLKPPIANSDLPRQIERDNSFMVLTDLAGDDGTREVDQNAPGTGVEAPDLSSCSDDDSAS